ncbi:MAG: hydrogenase maturation factor [Lachnospiraceae bacterium]|nr:hydrogenase maturation factor [Lachnospiraceae bacterium]
MNCGKLTESIYERSVIKVVKTNSTENRKFYDGAGLGADCAVLADSRTPHNADETCSGSISGQAMASGMDKKVIVRAYLAAVNHVIACCANKAVSGLQYAHANITVAIPEKMREIKVRSMIEAVSVQAEDTGIPILTCNVEVLPAVVEPVVTCVVNAGMENKSDSNPAVLKKRALTGEDIVMTKWLGLEGTAVIAQGSLEKLCRRYPADIVEEAADFYRYLSIVPEAATAVKSGASYLHVLREGGVFGGLWELAAVNGVGLVVDLKRIPVRQETVEVCEFFDLNPYELMAGGSLLIAAPNGGELVRVLDASGVPAAVIGRTAPGNDRIIRHGEESRFLEPANGDQLYRYYAHALRNYYTGG